MNTLENEVMREQALRAIKSLTDFVGRSQLAVVKSCMQGEERQFFEDKMVELAEVVKTMPATYGQDGKGDQALVYLHYFKGGSDWFITEKDSVANEPQLQAFGLADLFHDGGELGYISIQELIENNVELDFYWTPKTLAEVKAKRAV